MRHCFASSTEARGQRARVLLQLLLEQLEELERVGGRPGEPREDLALREPADLPRGRLHDGLVERDLPVARHDDLAVAADAEHGGPVERSASPGW